MNLKKIETQLKIVFGIYLLIELVLLFINTENDLTQGIIRFFLTFGLFYETYQGKNWARITLSILCVIAILISVSPIFTLVTRMLTIGLHSNAIFILVLLIFLLIIMLLIVLLIDSKKYKEYSKLKTNPKNQKEKNN